MKTGTAAQLADGKSQACHGSKVRWLVVLQSWLFSLIQSSAIFSDFAMSSALMRCETFLRLYSARSLPPLAEIANHIRAMI